MTNFKLFGYNEIQARDLIKKIRKILKQRDFDLSDMVITWIPGSTVVRLEDESIDNKAPYIEIADHDLERALTIQEQLSAVLKEDIEITTISKFVSAGGDQSVAPR